MATIEQLEQGLIKAKQSGNQRAMQVLGDELMRQRGEATAKTAEQTSVFPNMESQLRGLTLGLSDPLIAAGRAGIGSFTGGLPFKEGYRQERDALSAGKQQGGLMGAAQEVGASMLTGGMAAKLLPAAAQARPILSSVPLGAGTGATYSATQEQDPLTGAVLGGAMGPVGQVAGTAVGKGLGVMGRSILNRGGPQRAAALLERDVLEPTQSSIGDIADAMRKSGPGTLPLEVMGEAGTRSAMAASQASVGAKQQIRTAVDRRLSGRWNRLRGDVKRLMGGRSGEKFYKGLDDLIVRRREQARPLYEQAFKQEAGGDSIQALNQKWLSYIDEGIPDKNLPALSGSNLEALVKRSAKALQKGKGFKTKIGDLDNIQVALRQKAETFQRSNRGREALILRHMRGDILDVTDSASDVYRQARAVYQDESSIIDAMKSGRNILREDAEITEKALKGMSQAEHDAYLFGAAKTLRDETASKTPGFFQRNPLIQERLAHAFPDERSLNEFLEVSLSRESRLSEISSKVIHGSMTAEKTAAQKSGMIMAAKEILTGETGNLITRTASAFGQLLNRKYPPEVADELAKTLLTEGPEEFARRASLRLDPNDVDQLVKAAASAGRTGAVIGTQ